MLRRVDHLKVEFVGHLVVFVLDDVSDVDFDAISRTRVEEPLLAERIAEAMDVPDGMPITVHCEETDLVNAGATFGGHILLYRGLVSELESESGLEFARRGQAAFSRLEALEKPVLAAVNGRADSG